MGYTYREAGVDIDAGNKAVELMKPDVARTMRPEVIGGLGGFGGLFALDLKKYHSPVLVSGTDGVGTKLKLAFKLNQHDTIGIDAVAMCVNDILVQGAEPLFFLDYLAVGKLEPGQAADVVRGVAAGCELAGCALIGGETAEMPGFYPVGEYDIAGFAVGVVNREEIIDGLTISEGDLVIGLKSSGLHSNGYSLARKVFEEYSFDEVLPELGQPLGEVLLQPTRIYVKSVLAILKEFEVKGMAHITGGGLTENIPRVLPDGCGVEIDLNSWEVPAVFKQLRTIGQIAEDEMYRTFNMGIGFVLIIKAEQKEAILKELKLRGEEPVLLGRVVRGNGVSYR